MGEEDDEGVHVRCPLAEDHPVRQVEALGVHHEPVREQRAVEDHWRHDVRNGGMMGGQIGWAGKGRGKSLDVEMGDGATA